MKTQLCNDPPEAVHREEASRAGSDKVKIAASRVDVLVNKLVQARNRTNVSSSEFSETFREAVEVLGLNERYISRLFQISRPTSWRWQKGESAPHRYGRLPVFRILENEARKKKIALKKK